VLDAPMSLSRAGGDRAHLREPQGGHLQLTAILSSLQKWHHHAPTAAPGPGAAVGAERGDRGSSGGRGGARGRQQ